MRLCIASRWPHCAPSPLRPSVLDQLRRASEDAVAALEPLDVVTGWFDDGIIEGGKNKLVPSVTMKLRNKSDRSSSRSRSTPSSAASANRKCGASISAGPCRAPSRCRPAPKPNTLVMRSTLGYTGDQPRMQMLQNQRVRGCQGRDLSEAGLEGPRQARRVSDPAPAAHALRVQHRRHRSDEPVEEHQWCEPKDIIRGNDEPRRPALERRLGPLDGAAIIVSNVIGGTILFAPPFMAGLVPNPWLYLGLWLAGGALAFAGAMAYAELAALRPKAGGEIRLSRRRVWARRRIPDRLDVVCRRLFRRDCRQRVLHPDLPRAIRSGRRQPDADLHDPAAVSCR